MPNQSKEVYVPELKVWDVSKYLAKDGIYLILGDRGKGKTTITEIILQSYPLINVSPVIGMCGAEKVRANWYRSIPRLFVIGPNVEFLQGVVAQQNEHIKRYADKGLELPAHLHVILILDDIALFKDVMTDQVFAQIVAISRNLGILIFVLAQYLIQIAKANRRAFNGIGLVGPFDPDTLKELHKLWAFSFVPSWHQFAATVNAYTKDFGMLMIDRHKEECFKVPCKWPFESMLFGPPSQKVYSDKILALREIQRKKEMLQREHGQSDVHPVELQTSNLLDTTSWRRFTAENGKTFVFAPVPAVTLSLSEDSKKIEHFVDITLDTEDLRLIRGYNIYYSRKTQNKLPALLPPRLRGSPPAVPSPPPRRRQSPRKANCGVDQYSDSDTTISDSDMEERY